MGLTLKKASMLLLALSALTVTIALAASPASAQASIFCNNQRVNIVQKCWGASRNMTLADGVGLQTGVCIGADLVHGSCAPVGELAVVRITYGNHAPWVMGTASAFTYVSTEVN